MYVLPLKTICLEEYKAEYVQNIYIAWILYGITIAMVKVSLLLQYLKILMPVRKYSVMRLTTFIVIGVTSLFYFISTFFEIFACSPRERFWNPLVKGHCFNVDDIQITSTALNSASDFVILMLPQVVIWRLQMSFQNRLKISAVFLTGFL